MAEQLLAAGDLDADSTGTLHPAIRREVFAWTAVAITALAIAGAFAFLLAFSRIPSIERVFPWPLGFFGKGLVIHVVFSFVVWFLCIFAALAALARGPAGPGLPWLGRLAPALAALALPLLLAPAFLDRGEATLNNYIPVIIDPLYYAGLVVLAIAIAIAALRLVLAFPLAHWRQRPLAAAVTAAAATYLAALVAFALSYAGLAGSTFDFALNEHLMWGGGHLLQFVNTTIALVAWGILAGIAAPGPRPPLTIAVVAGLLTASAWLGLLFYALYPAFSGPQMQAFTNIQYAFGPATVIALLTLVGRVRKTPVAAGASSAAKGVHPALLCLALSILVFGAGGFLGLFVDGSDTRTPAHYHGVIAGVTLALIGVAYFRLLPWLERPSPSRRRVVWTIGLFGWGQLAACIGLFIAGGHGAPRKVAGAAQGLSDWAAYAGMGLNGLGGLVAVIGGILFVWTMAAALLRPSLPATISATGART